MRFLLRPIVLLALLAAVLAPSASAGLKLGVAEDAPKGMDDGGAAMFQQMRGVGMSVVRMTVFWDETQPTIRRARPPRPRTRSGARRPGAGPAVDHAAPPDRRHGDAERLRPVRAVLRPRRAALPVCQGLHHRQRAEPAAFWQPQFDARGRRVAAATHLYALIRARDSLESYDPSIRVIGVGLSPRGNDAAHAKSNGSTSPVMFIHDLGVAYRAAARKAPFLDTVNFHPYPNPSSGADAPSVGCAGRTRAFRTSTACSRRGGTRSTGPANRSSRRTANFAA